ncbi:MAG: TerD family protein [Micavibrio sp.]
MTDFDNEDDIFKKMQADDDDIMPIDIGAGAPPKPQGRTPGSPPLDEFMPKADNFPKPLDEGEEFKQEIPSELAGRMFDDGINYIKRGEYVDLLRKDPTLRQIRIGAGWEQRAIEEERVDIDLSVFLLDRHEVTRDDNDFIFYNNESGLEGGCKHQGDSRTGAGEGDDETILIDLNSIPFDVQKVMFVFSIYDEEVTGLNFSLVRDVFIRVINEESGDEICRFAFDDEELTGGNGCYVAALIREGPQWTFEAIGQFVNGGLAEIATKYGIIVRELQSTG